MIVSDDQGAWALGCAGNKDIVTPNIDSLAKNGVRFENFFCTSPVCSPARASMLTGRIPSQHGIHDWLEDSTIERKKIEYLENQNSYVDILSEAGYTCGLSGKWHMGASHKPQKGFSHWFAHESGSGPYYAAPMYKNGELYVETDYITDVITDDAIQFVNENKDTPFYLHIGYTAPHSPWIDNHPKEYTDLYKNCLFESVPQSKENHPNSIFLTHEVQQDITGNLIGYFASITAMDYNIGRIIDELVKLDLREETLIIFTSDNGFSCGHHGFWGKGNGTFPINLFDTSVKVPFIINYPPSIKKGIVSDKLISAYDIRPTILDLVNLPDSPDITLPGQSFINSLYEENFDIDEENNHIYILDEYGPNRMVRNKDFKLIKRYPYGPDEFYDLRYDPNENDNKYFDPDYQSVIEEMTLDLSKWFLTYANPEIDGSRESVFGSGQKNLAGDWSKGKQSYILEDYIRESPKYNYD
ncbi:sulfatase [Vagococcus elongatus]|uniref:Sulfatase n=2 Tax=Vagococcus elongatus TaxID=180344 RepID=A0A430AHR9_9ENTE|nr:sulfatase [Vagococcus elongatus]